MSALSAAQKLPFDFNRGEVSLFSRSVAVRLSFRGVSHVVELSHLKSVPWRWQPPTWASVRAQAFAFLNERYSTSPALRPSSFVPPIGPVLPMLPALSFIDTAFPFLRDRPHFQL